MLLTVDHGAVELHATAKEGVHVAPHVPRDLRVTENHIDVALISCNRRTSNES
jgi:hypothetical protein